MIDGTIKQRLKYIYLGHRESTNLSCAETQRLDRVDASAETAVAET